MKILYLDCGMGAAGDMLAAALAELLPETQREDFVAELNNAGIPGVHVHLDPSVKCGITGTHLTVTVDGEEEASRDHHDHAHDHGHDHEHSHDHSHGGHTNDHSHSHEHWSHAHRSLHDIHHIIDDLKLPESVRQDILSVYTLIAEAESKAHDKPVSEIHFHEVGTMDAIADIASVCLLLHRLAPDEIVASPVHVGSGQVKCAHGILPVPAPATAYLLQDIPMYGGQIQGELCTPTGAALLKQFVTRFGQMPLMTPKQTGYGMGKKDFEAANCIRAILGESGVASDSATVGELRDTVCELACNVDDITGEDIAFAVETFLRNGALDAFTIPCTMKKGRPGVLLTVLCRENDQQKIAEMILQHTTTLGVRATIRDRWILQRSESKHMIFGSLTPDTEESSAPDSSAVSDDPMAFFESAGTAIRCKTSTGYGVNRSKYEYDDLVKIAREHGLTLQQVRELVEKYLHSL